MTLAMPKRSAIFAAIGCQMNWSTAMPSRMLSIS